MGCRLEECFLDEKYHIRDANGRICPHVLTSILTLLSLLLKGVSAKTLGIGKEDDTGYV